MFSGNNMVMSDDVAMRMLVSRIESQREDPRARPARSFLFPDLLDAIRKRRAKLVRACLVIVRAYIAARDAGESVPDAGTRGSFEAWSRLIPNAILWAGGPNMLRAFPEAGRGGDEESEAHVTLMRHWRKDWNGQRASVIHAALFDGEEASRKRASEGEPGDGLDEARAAVRLLLKCRERQVPSSIVFRNKLHGMRQKIRDGLRIESTHDRHLKSDVFTVASIA
jgi:hypothetical protein